MSHRFTAQPTGAHRIATRVLRLATPVLRRVRNSITRDGPIPSPQRGERLNIVIFSKDRACQLELLLRSIKIYVDLSEQIRISVLYTASNAEFDRGYRQLKPMFPGVAFHDERTGPRDFKFKTLCLARTAIPYLMFLVDDDVFKNPFSLADEEFRAFERSSDQVCLSLRLGKHISYCYSMDLPTPPPPFLSEWVWEWRGLAGDWGYPMSLDGHVFRTADILPLLNSRHYTNPNTLESALADRPLHKLKMSCYEQSRVLNLPVNRVKSVFANRSGNVEQAELNAIFLAKGRIRLEPFDGYVNSSPHQELALEFTGISDQHPCGGHEGY